MHFVAHVHTEEGQGIEEWLADNDVTGLFERIDDEPSKQQVKDAMDVLKAAGCAIDTKMRLGSGALSGGLMFVVYVPLDKMEDI